MEDDRDIHWSEPLELLVASEGEKCRGLAWINQRAEVYYAHRANAIAIPVIVLSTLAGTASVGSSSLFQGDTQISSVVIGLVSIGVGILNTISSYFSWARKAEAHRIAYLQYSKLFSTIRVEMSLPRAERKEADTLLAQIRDGMERLAETTPSPPPVILDEFNRHFKDEDKTISRPVETNGLQKISVFRSSSIQAKLDDVLVEIKTNPMLDGKQIHSQQRLSRPQQREDRRDEPPERTLQVPLHQEGSTDTQGNNGKTPDDA
jgi:hypothetical protein